MKLDFTKITEKVAVWCDILNMFCDDVEQEELEIIQCDGECNDCEHCSEVI
jgi:hypothetical protein